jgi:replication initiation and membrane attachment protein DnaB
MFHELFDLYHPYIGDKATMYYLYLLRYRNNEVGNVDKGKAWKGRSGAVEKFQLSYSTLPILDEILEASGLVTIEHKPIGRGRDKIYYVVHDPKERQYFRNIEKDIKERLKDVILKQGKKKIGKLLGKEKGAKLLV